MGNFPSRHGRNHESARTSETACGRRGYGAVTFEDAAQPLSSPSLAKASTARLTAQVAGVLFGAVSSVVAARSLGPAGKGVFSTLLFITHELVFYAASFGLGDAAMIMRGRREVRVGRALNATIPLLLVTSLLGIAVAAGVARIVLDQEWETISVAVLIALILIPFWVFFDFFVHILNSDEAIVFTSIVIAASTAISAIGLVIALPVLHAGIAGGVIGSGFGPLFAMVVCYLRLKRTRSLRPTIDLDYLRRALPLGMPILGSYLLVALSQRVDQLIVFSIAGQSAAGQYSVALTVGLVATHAPIALSLASFPRLTRMAEEDAAQLTARICRIGIAAATVAAAGLLVVSPFLVPALFGPGFQASVTPGLILLAASILWSAQWLMARARAARGGTHLLFTSFTVSVVITVVGDLVLIPPLGIVGAALAALCGAALGAGVCLRTLSRSGGYAIRELLPSPKDFVSLKVEVVDIIRTAIARVRASASGGRTDD